MTTENPGGLLDIARIQKDVREQGFRLYLGIRTDDGPALSGPVQLTVKPAGALTDPTGVITVEAAQRLFDDLWEDGLRPSTYQRDVSDEVAWLRTQLGLIIGKEWK